MPLNLTFPFVKLNTLRAIRRAAAPTAVPEAMGISLVASHVIAIQSAKQVKTGRVQGCEHLGDRVVGGDLVRQVE